MNSEDINQEFRDLKKTDPVVLGKIMAAQNVLFVLPYRKDIAGFFAKSLSSIPGVESCSICFGNTNSQKTSFGSAECAECVNMQSEDEENSSISKETTCRLEKLSEFFVFAIETFDYRFGYFVFRINQPELFELYQPFIRNLGNFIALSLENRLQKGNLQNARDILENTVKERTKELQSVNTNLKEEIEEHTQNEAINVSRMYLIQYSLTHSLDELLEETLNETEKLTGSLIGFYHFVEEDQKSLRLQNWSTRTKAVFCKAEGKGLHYAIDQAGIWVECVSQRKAVIHNDYASMPNRKGMPAGHAEVIRELVAPVFRGGKISAILGVGNKATDYNEKDVETISLIADLAWEIAERKRVEDALLESQQVFRSLVENSPDIIARYDRNCNRIYVNPVYLKEALIPQQELLTTTPIQRSPLPPASAIILQSLLQKVLNSGIAEAVDVIWPKTDNIDHWYNVYAFPEFDREGDVASVMTISRDITKRKQAEEQVRKLNRFYAVLSNINQSIVRIHDSRQLFDQACRIAVEFGKFRLTWIGLVNPATNKLDVVASAGVFGDYLEKINIDLNDERRGNGPAGTAFKTGKYSISNNIMNDIEMAPWCEDAIKYGYKSVASFPLKTFEKTIGVFLIYSDEADFFDNDDINLLSETAMDISFALESMENETERRRSEENLLKAKEKAEESDRLKTAFLHNISHEIRTPMNAIVGFSGLLSQNYNDKQKIEKFTKIINQRCEDLLVIINGLLDIAKIESGQFPVNIEECDLNKLFAELTTLFNEHRKRIDKQHIIFKLQSYCNPVENTIYTDIVKLKEIFINLISNAFKFTDNGKIEGGCKLDKDGKLLFYLSDTGLGIPTEKYNQIFERFYQIPAGTNRLNEGTGLGLSIVKGFVHLLGGEIWLESELGKGTTFYFSISYKASIITKNEPLINKKQESLNLKNRTILIVEDDLYNAEFIKEILSNTGLTIIHTIFGKEAVKIAGSDPPDLILMDIRLPDINGYEAIRKIRQLNRNIKIIAQTAYAAQEDNQKAFDAGCIDYISKPLKSNLLLSMLSRHLI